MYNYIMMHSAKNIKSNIDIYSSVWQLLASSFSDLKHSSSCTDMFLQSQRIIFSDCILNCIQDF